MHPMKTLLLVLLIALPSFAQKVEYDKFKDKTTVSGESVRLERSIVMAVKASHDGQTPTEIRPYLIFWSTSRSWSFLRSHGLIILADGERIDLGDGTHDGHVRGGRSVSVAEVMIYPISRSDLEKIVKATAVEMKLGFMEMKLEDKDKRGLREVLAYK